MKFMLGFQVFALVINIPFAMQGHPANCFVCGLLVSDIVHMLLSGGLLNG